MLGLETGKKGKEEKIEIWRCKIVEMIKANFETFFKKYNLDININIGEDLG